MSQKNKFSLFSDRGATLVETSICLIILFIFLILSIDFIRITYTAATSQFITNSIARDAAIGTGITAVCTGAELGGYEQNACNLRKELKNRLAMFGVPEVTDTGADTYFAIYATRPGVVGIDAGSTGNPGDLLVVNLNIPIRIMTPLGGMIGYNANTVLITASAVVRNEY